MTTERYGQVSVARAVEFDFFANGAVAGTVTLNRFGGASLTVAGTETPLHANVDTADFSFTYTKSGKGLLISQYEQVELAG